MKRTTENLVDLETDRQSKDRYKQRIKDPKSSKITTFQKNRNVTN